MDLRFGAVWILPWLAMGVAGLAMAALTRWARALPQALPGPRSLHGEPLPRVGGLSVWAGALPVSLLVPPALPGNGTVWLAAWGGVTAISLVDDFRGVHPIYRVAGHLLAAAMVANEIVHDPPNAPTLLALAVVAGATLVIAWAANLYNFMDGSDGLAAVMGACGFTAYGVAAAYAGTAPTAYFALAAATVPFLVRNVPPARMFMGDVGAVPLGFLAAACGIGGWRVGAWPAWFPILVFLPFIADATVTLGRRVWRRERFWEAHKMHYYQRLHQLGAGHRGTLLVFGVLIAGTVVSALMTLVLDRESGWVVTAAWGGAMAALFSGIEYYWQHRIPKPR